MDNRDRAGEALAQLQRMAKLLVDAVNEVSPAGGLPGTINESLTGAIDFWYTAGSDALNALMVVPE